MTALSLDKLETLIEINSRINSNYSNVNALLIYILESAMRLIECESSFIILANGRDDSLRFSVALGPKGREIVNSLIGKKSLTGWVVQNNQAIIVNDVASDERFSSAVYDKTGYDIKSLLAVPMCVKGICIGVVEIVNKAQNRLFDNDDLKVLKMLCEQACIAYQNASEYKDAQDQIAFLQNNLSQKSGYHSFIAKSRVVLDLLHVIEAVAATNSSVLITGESGVGKELFAEQLHLKSPRAKEPFIRVNCAALSQTLLESELFGHVKGAFTDAVSNQVGRFQAADKGTLFLDEIGEIPLDLQAKLLRVIQSRQFEQVGSSQTISVDVRIVAATNRDLETMVKSGLFRADLYYRLNVLPINIPPLRERKDDIEPLSNFFLKKFGSATKKNFQGFSSVAIQELYKYYWPGNIRELENTIERSCVLGVPPLIQVQDLRLPESVDSSKFEEIVDGDSFLMEKTLAEEISNSSEDRTLKAAINRFKKAYVIKILTETSWNQTKAGKILGIQRTYVSRLLNELHIREDRDNL